MGAVVVLPRVVSLAVLEVPPLVVVPVALLSDCLLWDCLPFECLASVCVFLPWCNITGGMLLGFTRVRMWLSSAFSISLLSATTSCWSWVILSIS